MVSARNSDAVPHFGFKLPNIGGLMCPPEWATPATVESLAREAAAAGYQSLWLQDHILTPQEMEELTDPPFLEPFTVAVRLAALVPDVQIGVATFVLPLRDPVMLAKQLATADRFFPGRFIAGIGAGRYASEFERFGSNLFEQRGKVTEEYVRIMRALLTEDRVTIQGAFRSLTEAEMYPKPASGALRLWLHGAGPIGIRRAARTADGWIAGSPPLAEFKDEYEIFRKARVGQDGPTPTVAVSLRVDRAKAPREGLEHTDHGIVLRGTSDEVAAALGDYVSAGVTHFLMTFPSATVGELVEKLNWFASEVRPMITARGAVREMTSIE